MKKIFLFYLIGTIISYAWNDQLIENSPNSVIVGRDNISLNLNLNIDNTSHSHVKNVYNTKNNTKNISNKIIKIQNTTIQQYDSALLKKIQMNFTEGQNSLEQKITQNQKEILTELYGLSEQYNLLTQQDLEHFEVLVDSLKNIEKKVDENNKIGQETQIVVGNVDKKVDNLNRKIDAMSSNPEILLVTKPLCKDIENISDITLNVTRIDTQEEKNKFRCLKEIYPNYKKKYLIDISGYNSFEDVDRVAQKIVEMSDIPISNLSPAYVPNGTTLESHTVHLNLIPRDY